MASSLRMFIVLGDPREDDAQSIYYLGPSMSQARNEMVAYLRKHNTGPGRKWPSKKKFDADLLHYGAARIVILNYSARGVSYSVMREKYVCDGEGEAIAKVRTNDSAKIKKQKPRDQ